jgi:predicted dehydrogenase
VIDPGGGLVIVTKIIPLMRPETPDRSPRQPRREFIKQTATLAAALVAAPAGHPTVLGQAPSAGRVLGANDRINLGFIGVGGQGMNAHVAIASKHAAVNKIALAAVCDVWPKRTAYAKAFIEKAGTGSAVKEYADYRQLLERRDIDAVVIATHDPIHAEACLQALDAGKHVYCEKPMTRYFGEGFAVHDAVKRTGKVLQVGSQGCSAAAWHKAAELIQAGKIGQLVWAQGYYCRNNPEGEWNYPLDPDAKEGAMDWEKWLGPVKKRVKFSADHYFRWRKYYPYCAGLLGDLIPHRLLPLMLATGKPEFPARVSCVGTKHVRTDRKTAGTAERDVPEQVELLVQFPSGVSLVLASSSVNARSPGFALYGHHATLEVGSSGERLQIIPERPFADEIEPEAFEGLTPTEDIGAHHANWFDCIRTNQQPHCGIDLAVRAQTVIALAEMSQRLGVMCHFDEKTRRVTNGDGKEIKPITYGTLELS